MHFLICIVFALAATVLFNVGESSKIYPNKQRSTEYDYIIVGSGSAGSVLASRLTEDVSTSVLLLEAGGIPNGMSDVPAFYFDNIPSPDMNWGYLTEPQEGACLGLKDKRSVHPRGKALGGSSSLNGMLQVRGNRRDFDEWAKVGAVGWGWDDVYKYFEKLENRHPAHPEEENVNEDKGFLTITNITYKTPLQDAYLKAAEYLGLPTVEDSDENQIGLSKIQVTTRDGRRCGAERGYLRPAASRENLDILIHAHATKLLIDDDKRAHSVRFEHKNASHTVSARKEIILSAGVYGSAQLLLLSGIGPKKHLQDLGIPVVADLPVGENLQDHFCSGGHAYTINSSVSMARPYMITPQTIGEFQEGTGPLTVPATIESIGYVNSKYQDPAENWPDIQIFFLSSIYIPRMDIPEHVSYLTRHGITAQPMLRRPKGRGFMRLRSTNPFDHPIINPRYLSEEDDLNRLIDGMKFVEEMMKTPPMQAFSPVRIKEITPGCDNMDEESDDYWRCMARTLTMTNFHVVGTCKMGDPKDPTTVVDPELRVKGVSGLRVADTSVMPMVTSGNTNAPAFLIGEKAADMIRGL